MSRDPYYGGGRGRGERWDTERFTIERDRNRIGGETRERFEERDSRFLRSPGFGRARERSVDEIYERRGPRVFEEDKYERKEYYDEPRMERERPLGRDRGTSITIEKERDFYESPPRRASVARPSFLRRQSSLDTFDRKPLTRFVEREEYGPPARYREREEYREELYRDDARPPPFTPIPLPRTKALPPPRRYAERDFREYEEIKVAEPDFYGDEDYRGFPERVREREIIRRRRRSRSKESGQGPSVRGSVRSDSVSSSSSSEAETVRNEFPKKGKTRMPARLVSKKAIIDLGYPFEEEGDVIVIQKALGRENIDEVIKLSEDYKASESRINSGTVVEERRTEVFNVPAASYPPPPPPGWIPPPPPGNFEVITDTKVVEHRRSPSPRHHHHSNGPVIINAGPGPYEETTFVERRTETVGRSDPIPIGPLALIPSERHRSKDERAIRAEIKALEAEKEALRAEKRADKEMRRADRIRRGARASEGDLVLYDRETIERGGEEVTLVRRERISEPDGGVRIEKDKKAPPPKLVRAMLATLT